MDNQGYTIVNDLTLLADIRLPLLSQLAISDTNEAVDHLIDSLEDESADIRRLAATMLGRLGVSRAVESLVIRLVDDVGYVRRAASEALKELGDPHWQILLWGDAQDWNLVGSSGDGRLVLPLIKRLGTSAADIRIAVAKTLRQLGEPKWQSLIQGVIEDLERLGCSGDSRAFEPLITALAAPDSHFKLCAVNALGRMGDTRAVVPLIDALRDFDSGVRLYVVGVLGELGDERAVDPLVKMLVDKEWFVRHAAVIALGNLKDIRVIEHLFVALCDVTPDCRVAAAEVLAMFGESGWVYSVVGTEKDWCVLARSQDDRVCEPLARLMYCQNRELRCAVVKAIEQANDVRFIDHMIVALFDIDVEVCCFAARSLGRMGDVRSIVPLKRMLQNRDLTIRYEVAIALGRLNDVSAIEPLSDYILQGAGICADETTVIDLLGRLSAVDTLVQVLNDRSCLARTPSARFVAAVEALGKTGDERAVGHLITALVRPPEIRRASAVALAKLGEPLWQDLVKGEDGDLERLADSGDNRVTCLCT